METTIWQAYQNEGIIMLGIINTSNQTSINNFVEENSITFPILFDPGSPGGVQGGDTYDDYYMPNDGSPYPRDFIVDIQGILQYANNEIDTEWMLYVLDELIGNYRSQLQIELNMGHYKTASYLLKAIENISMIRRMKEPKWDDNPFMNEVNKILSNEKIEENHIKPSLSATSIQTYNQCPLKYKYQYIDAIPSAPEKLYFQLGKVIHKVLELFHESEYSSFDDLLMLLDKNWLVGGYKYDQQQEQYRLDAINMLNNYWKYIQKNPVNKIITEHWFSFESEHAYLSGKCDRIDIDAQDKISIIDYKTSQTTKTENEIKKDIHDLLQDFRTGEDYNYWNPSLILISHDIGFAYKIVDKIIIMYRGTIVQKLNLISKVTNKKIPINQLLDNKHIMLHPYTRALFESVLSRTFSLVDA